MAQQSTRVERAQKAVGVIRKSIRDVEAEFDAIISEGGGTLGGAVTWLDAASPALPADTVTKLSAARTAIIGMRAALSADNNAGENALAQFES